MNIAVDARPLSKQRTGVENYVGGLLHRITTFAPEHRYLLYSNRELHASPPNCEVRIDDRFGRVPGAFWCWLRGGQLARKDNADVFWSTYPILPASLPNHVFKIITVYDLVWLRFPETTSFYNLAVQKALTARAIQQADRIIVISRSTQEDLIRECRVAPEKTRLVYPGIEDRYRALDPGHCAKLISDKYDVPSGYMAAVGSVEPRKNLKVLVEAVRILKSRGKLVFPLLIAGASGWKNSELFSAIRSAGLNDSDIRFMGYLPDADLPAFYAGAKLFLFPSLYEGFGIPPVEAMACGTPVIASDAPCMPEVLGDAAVLLPASSAAGIADGIIELLSDDQRRNALIAAGQRRAEQFRWHSSVEKLLAVFEEGQKSREQISLRATVEVSKAGS